MNARRDVGIKIASVWATKHRKEEEIEQLKEEVRKELLGSGDKESLEQLQLIDAIQRLGVDYHFKNEIEDVLTQIYESYHIQSNKDNLYHLSTRFRILRQHGFNMLAWCILSFKRSTVLDSHCINILLLIKTSNRNEENTTSI
ncbi:(-)-alpha-pinene synthase-like [Amaranthus tricolor]|uniref:(-)-alpha-pinene synthase-like n=1 Tax=Amaranthus tricolor TaxID=29722 RepID=UPI00258BFC57|nr:(-)-alpha-pinene synthase-like [Amaranthus tricolor]